MYKSNLLACPNLTIYSKLNNLSKTNMQYLKLVCKKHEICYNKLYVCELYVYQII